MKTLDLYNKLKPNLSSIKLTSLFDYSINKQKSFLAIYIINFKVLPDDVLIEVGFLALQHGCEVVLQYTNVPILLIRNKEPDFITDFEWENLYKSIVCNATS